MNIHLFDLSKKHNFNMNIFKRASILLILSNVLIQNLANTQCCLQFKSQVCVKCPKKMHLYRENCIFDLPNCISYENGFHCKECSNGFEVEESTKKCIKQKDHTDVILDVDNIDPSDEMGTAFMVSNDLVKSIHTQVLQGKALKATYREYLNGTKQMIIEYKVDPGNKYYKAVLIINLDTFIFNEVSFERFKPILAKEVQKVQKVPQKPKVRQNSENKNVKNQTSKVLTFKDKTMNPFDSKRAQLLKKVDKIAKGKDSSLLGVTQAKIREYSDGTEEIILTYLTTSGQETDVVVAIQGESLIYIGVYPKGEYTSQKIKNKQNNTVNPPTEESKNQNTTQDNETVEKTEKREKEQTKNETEVKNETKPEIVKNKTEVKKEEKNETKPTPVENSSKPNVTQTVKNQSKKIQNSENETKTNAKTENTTKESSPETKKNETTENSKANETQTNNTKINKAKATPPKVQTTKPQDKTTNKTKPNVSAGVPLSKEGYKEQKINDMLKDLYYIVCKDKINKKFEGYTELLPKQGFTKSDAKTRYFIVVFEKKDGTIWQVSSHIDLVSYSATIGDETLIKGTKGTEESKEDSRKYTSLQVSKAFKDVYFLITMDKMGKQLNNKYKTAKIVELGSNEDTKDLKYFRVVFGLNNSKFKVVSFVNKKTFSVQVQSDQELVQKSSPPPKVQNKTQPLPVTESKSDSNKKNQTKKKEEEEAPKQQTKTETPKEEVPKEEVKQEVKKEVKEEVPKEEVKEQTPKEKAKPSETPKENLEQGKSKQQTPKEQTKKQVPPKENPKEQITKQENPKKESPKQQTPKETPKEEEAKVEEASKKVQQEEKPSEQPPKLEKPKEQKQKEEEKPEDQVPQKENPKQQPTKKEIPQEITPKEESPQVKTPKEENPQKQTPKQQTPQEQIPEEKSKQQPTKQESPTESPPKQQKPQNEKPKQQPVKEESPKKEIPKQETPKQQPPKEQKPKEQTPKGTPKQQKPKEETPKEQPSKAQAPKEQKPKQQPPKEVTPPKEQLPKVVVVQDPNKQIELNPLILSQTGGYHRLTNAQLKEDKLFLTVKQRLQMINDDELKDAKLVAAFMKGLGFTRQFRIYYSAADSGTYQGQIRYDILRRRSYIISFGKTNYSLT